MRTKRPLDLTQFLSQQFALIAAQFRVLQLGLEEKEISFVGAGVNASLIEFPNEDLPRFSFGIFAPAKANNKFDQLEGPGKISKLHFMYEQTESLPNLLQTHSKKFV